MAQGRAAGLVNLTLVEEPDEDEDRTIVGRWDAVHSLGALASEAEADDPTHVEREAPVALSANDTAPIIRSEVRALSPRLSSIPPAPEAGETSTLLSQPPEPMLFTESAMPPPPRATPATAATYPTLVPPAFASTATARAPRAEIPFAAMLIASPATPGVPPPMESSVLPLSREPSEPPMGALRHLPRPAKMPTRVEGLLFASPLTAGSVVVSLPPPSAIAREAKEAPVMRAPSASFVDLRDLVGIVESDLARRLTEPMPGAPTQPPPLAAIPPPPVMPRASALGLEAFVERRPPEMALESVLPPAPPPPEVLYEQPTVAPLPLGGQPSELALEAVLPKHPRSILFVATVAFFIGYVVRAAFGPVVAQVRELGREIFEALLVEWRRAAERARRG